MLLCALLRFFDTQITDATALLHSARTNFQDGVVAFGQITVKQDNTQHTCVIGGNVGSSCSCTPTADCSQELSCFGSLCDYSKVALAPNTTYKVCCALRLQAAQAALVRDQVHARCM
jgi:hypothetical protein